jgi:hypothetical protein
MALTRDELDAILTKPRCPECRCDPYTCATDDTGDHCEIMSCGPCLNGCPLDECPEHVVVR